MRLLRPTPTRPHRALPLGGLRTALAVRPVHRLVAALALAPLLLATCTRRRRR